MFHFLYFNFVPICIKICVPLVRIIWGNFAWFLSLIIIWGDISRNFDKHSWIFYYSDIWNPKNNFFPRSYTGTANSSSKYYLSLYGFFMCWRLLLLNSAWLRSCSSGAAFLRLRSSCAKGSILYFFYIFYTFSSSNFLFAYVFMGVFVSFFFTAIFSFFGFWWTLTSCC